MNKTAINKKSLLITGGAGFIGANLVRHFLNKNYEIHSLIKPATDIWRLTDIKNSINFHAVDLTDKEKLQKLAEKVNPSTIIHLAAYGNSNTETDIDESITVNILGTINLLHATKNIPYKAFINTGSSSEYGFKSTPMKETDHLEPNSFYAATKASATYLCQVFSHAFNKPITTIRPFSVYGYYEHTGRLIPNIILAVLKNTPINLTPLKVKHDFIFIDDLVKGYEKAIGNIDKASGKVINLGTGKQFTNQQIVDALFKITNKKVKVLINSEYKRTWDSPYWSADIKLAKKLLNWEPKYDLKSGIDKSYRWFVKNIKHYGN